MIEQSDQVVHLCIDEEKLLHVLQDLIRIQSVNPDLDPKGSGESEIAYYIAKKLTDLGLVMKYQMITETRFNVIGIMTGTGKGKTLMLNGHMDTVGIQGYIEPLEPVYSDGNVYGRGSFDMKCGLATMIMIAETIVKSGIQLEGDLMLAFVVDEEYKSIGTEGLVKEFTADAAILCEPTNMEVIVTHKGFAWEQIEIHGKAAHGSLPNEGIDAILKAGKVLYEIEKLSRQLTTKSHPLLGSPSIHASLISGGTELSTYPNYCKIELERRTIPGEAYTDIVSEMQGLLQRFADEDEQFKADLTVLFSREPFEVSQDEEIVQLLQQSYATCLQQEGKISGFGGWGDSGLLQEAGIPTVIFGPSGEGAHAVNEHVCFTSLVQTTTIILNTVVQYCVLAESQNQ
ncbi:UNVERIFIED_CONTAM: acetylornithine deacetylase [Brevibacillus sp. OAP136]